MEEYVTEAVVLEKREVGEADTRVTLYAQHLGRITARARGTRKMTSKLSSHLEPGSISLIRLVRRRALHITDAISLKRVPEAETVLQFLLDNTLDGERDARTWNALLHAMNACANGRSGIGVLLQAMGYSPTHAMCTLCATSPVGYILSGKLDFYCAPCGNAFPRHALHRLIAIA